MVHTYMKLHIHTTCHVYMYVYHTHVCVCVHGQVTIYDAHILNFEHIAATTHKHQPRHTPMTCTLV
jgi:hypothetical protein